MIEKPLTYEQVLALDLPNIIAYAGPVMVAFVLLEWFISFIKNHKLYDGKDAIAATAVGIVNVILGAILKIVTFGIVLFVYNHVPWSIPHTWWAYPLCLIWTDFWRYVAHKIGHESRFWWATHITHHSSKKYNLSVSFRLGWTQYIKIIFFLPVIVTGFDPIMFFICHQIEVLYQFWIHTEYIRKLPRFVEYIFVTPSHHRVHHATNDLYIDKNYGSTFIIWDRIFGTFQPELNTPNYGITKPPESYNPVYLVFHEFIDIWKDLKKASGIKEYLWILFASPAAQARAIKEDETEAAAAVPAPEANPAEEKV